MCIKFNRFKDNLILHILFNIQYNMDNNPVDNEIFFNVKDIKLADFKNIEDKYLTRKKNFYKVYFDDQMTNYPKNIIKVTLMGYLGGCFFGVIMLAFSMLGATRFDQSMASIKYEESLYKNMSEFKVAMKQVCFILFNYFTLLFYLFIY